MTVETTPADLDLDFVETPTGFIAYRSFANQYRARVRQEAGGETYALDVLNEFGTPLRGYAGLRLREVARMLESVAADVSPDE